MRWLVGLAGLLAIGAAAPAPKPIAQRVFVRWSGWDATRSWTSGGITATLARSNDGNGVTPTLTVRAPGKTPLTVTIDDGEAESNTYVAVGQLARGQSPSVIVQSWTGGAHCCFRLIAVIPAGNRFRMVDFGNWDGDRTPWPRDRDGDGVADFVLKDQSFLYAFGSYAGSWPPPVVMTIRDGKAADVSAEPAFRALFVADIAAPRKACLSRAEPNAGACAGWAADAARLGWFDTVWPQVVKAYNGVGEWPDSCSDSPRLDPCYSDYPSALRAFLREHGYIR